MTLASRIFGSLVRLPPPTTLSVSVERDLRTTMTDGTVLLADRWHPVDAQARRAPVILLRTPYGRRQWAGMIGRLFAERGYQVVIQSCRGTFGSEGEWVPFRNEKADGRATLDWIVNQHWFPGRLATFGPSYLGLTQWALAQDAPDCLRAMALSVTSSNFRDAVVYPSGCFALGTSLTWLRLLEYQENGIGNALRRQFESKRILKTAYNVLPVVDADVAAVGRPIPFFRDWLEHETPGDPWWSPVDFGRDLRNVPPASLVGGWYDLFLPSQVDDFVALRSAGRSVRLTIGPWSHSSPGAVAASLRDGLDWFDGHFNGGPDDRPRNVVRIFVMGVRRWVEFPDWPPPTVDHTWFLGDRGTLQTSGPGSGPPDHFHYDPDDPTPAVGGASLNAGDSGPKDQRPREQRSDVLTFTSEVLTGDLTVVGPLSADLYVRSTSDHCDFFVRLCDVSPKGTSTNLSDGLVRLTPEAMTKAADGSLLVHISMWPTAYAFRRNHRIRLQISSGAHPLFLRNSGTGAPLVVSSHQRDADQDIFHDPDHPSCLNLPVMRL